MAKEYCGALHLFTISSCFYYKDNAALRLIVQVQRTVYLYSIGERIFLKVQRTEILGARILSEWM